MRISLIIPCYNEETNIQKGVLDKIGNFTVRDDRFSEVLIIDDGSSDTSRDIIKKKYLRPFPKFRLIANPHQGKAFAIMTGIRESTSDWVMFMDMDLATPIEQADTLIKESEGTIPVIIGSRKRDRRGAPLLRKVMAWGFVFVRSVVIGLKGIKDTQCGFKLFKRDAAIRIIDSLKVFHDKRKTKDSSVTAGFDLEFLFLARKFRYRIREVPVNWRHVETKNVNFLRDSVETLKDIVKIKYLDLTGGYRK